VQVFSCELELQEEQMQYQHKADLDYTPSDRGETGESEIPALQSKDM
jgi:hypothetical protein